MNAARLDKQQKITASHSCGKWAAAQNHNCLPKLFYRLFEVGLY